MLGLIVEHESLSGIPQGSDMQKDYFFPGV